MSTFRLPRNLLPLFLALLPFVVVAQPPAQGPPASTVKDKYIGVSEVLTAFKQQVQTVLDTMNAQFVRNEETANDKAHLSFDFVVLKPTLMQTNYTDQPNNRIVRIHLFMTYHITDIHYHGAAYFSRDATQSVDITASCEGWTGNTGKATIRFAGQQPYVDGASLPEEAANIFVGNLVSDELTDRLNSALTGFANQTVLQRLSPCNCLSVDVYPTDTQDNQYAGSTIFFGYNAPRINIGGGGVLANQDETVSLVSVKRLPAHNLQGQPIYQADEDVTLILFVNQNARAINLGTMHENDEKDFTDVKFVFHKPTTADDNVVVIANIQQNNATLTEDSQFAVYTQSTGFGNGTQIITVNKTFAQRDRRLGGRGGGIGTGKPVMVTIGAYQLTLNVVYPNVANQ